MDGASEEPFMVLKTKRTDHARKADHVRAAQGRVDKRVKEILARRAAQRLKSSG
jgi:hypothetical protein